MSIACTIIIPHYNQWSELIDCLNSISRQSITPDQYEVIVVDNHTPGIRELWLTLPMRHNHILIINDSVQNPYTSRNMGVDHARGALLAFLDASCRPHENWLERGLYYFKNGHDCIAGRYNLILPSSMIHDRVHGVLYLNNEKNVRKHFGVPAGQLFVAQELFTCLGPFDDNHHSGNDIAWTLRLLDSGGSIFYAGDCIVDYPSPKFSDLLSKMSKYASGTKFLLLTQKRYHILWIKGLRSMLPMRPSHFAEALRYRGWDQLKEMAKLKLWFYVWQAKRHYAWRLLF